MAEAKIKTTPTAASVSAFLAGIDDADRRRDCKTVLGIMKRATGASPKMWGSSIVGFGSYDYRYASGGEGSAPIVGFSPRKRDLTLYVLRDFARRDALLAKLGKHTTGKSCLYIKRLADVDLDVLEKLVEASVEEQLRTQR
jgi:hypothetical protein